MPHRDANISENLEKLFDKWENSCRAGSETKESPIYIFTSRRNTTGNMMKFEKEFIEF